MPEDKQVFGIMMGLGITPETEPVSIPVRMFSERDLGGISFGHRLDTLRQALEQNLAETHPGSEWVIVAVVGTHKEALKDGIASAINGSAHTMIEIEVEE